MATLPGASEEVEHESSLGVADSHLLQLLGHITRHLLLTTRTTTTTVAKFAVEFVVSIIVVVIVVEGCAHVSNDEVRQSVGVVEAAEA
jgi:hypothetical protein